MARKRTKKSNNIIKPKKLPEHDKKCIVCGSHAHWETKKKGMYPLLCDYCLSNLPHPSDAIDDYEFIG